MTAWSFRLIAFSQGTSVFGRFGSLPNSAWAKARVVSNVDFKWTFLRQPSSTTSRLSMILFPFQLLRSSFLDPSPSPWHRTPNRRGEGPIGADIKNGLTTLLESIDEKGLSIVTSLGIYFCFSTVPPVSDKVIGQEELNNITKWIQIPIDDFFLNLWSVKQEHHPEILLKTFPKQDLLRRPKDRNPISVRTGIPYKFSKAGKNKLPD